jgi:hypothetical protein
MTQAFMLLGGDITFGIDASAEESFPIGLAEGIEVGSVGGVPGENGERQPRIPEGGIRADHTVEVQQCGEAGHFGFETGDIEPAVGG